MRLVIFILVFVSLSFQVFAEKDPRWVFETIETPSIGNNILGDETKRLIEVYLPPSYHSSKERYPVVYYLWGYNSRNRQPDFKVREHKRVFDEKIKNGLMGEMIVVFLDSTNRLRGSFYINSPVTGNWANLVVNDLIGHVDKTYRTIPKREARSIVGSSMGGFGAINLGMQYSDKFIAAYGLAPGAYDAKGFNDSQFVNTEGNIEKTIALIERLSPLSKQEAHKEYQKFLDENEDRVLWFTLAYGSAHAPDTSKAPYFKFPYSKKEGKIVVDESAWRLWQDGFGGFEHEIPKYRANIESMELFGFAVGFNESNRWLYNGCLFLSEQLAKNNLRHVLYIHEGTHTSLRNFVLFNHTMPLISNVMIK